MRLGRRAALVGLPWALSGCGVLDSLLGDDKKKVEGKREPILGGGAGLAVDTAQGTVVVPAAVPLAAWPQNGGTLAHAVGNVAVTGLSPAWSTGIGEGAGYRAKLTSQPLVERGMAYTMDSDGHVAAIDMAGGGRLWRVNTQAENNRSTNLGGGIAIENGTIYATTGRAEALALEAASGKILWRKDIGVPARSGPSVSGGRMHFTTLDDQVLALSLKDGSRAWGYKGSETATTVLADAAPAINDGFVVAGFGSGELVALRADSGSLVWSDSLAGSGGANSSVDLTAIRALPVIDRGRVYAIGVGGLLVALDLRTGRRLWEREIGGGQTPCLVGDWLFVQSSNQGLAAVNAADGHVRWVQELPRWANPAKQKDPIFWAGPLMAAGKLILAGTSEQAVSVDPVSGRLLGALEMGSSVSVSPVAASGTVLILTDSGALKAFR